MPSERIDLEEAERVGREATPGEWEATGDMVHTPPYAEQFRRIKAKELPFDSRRICLCNNDTYFSPEQCHANAAFIAYWKNNSQSVLDELRELRDFKQRHTREGEWTCP